MNIKPVEMQIAIPRVQEAGHTQQQLNHKPALDQHTAANLNAKLTEALQQKPNEVNKAHDSKVENRTKDSKHQERDDRHQNAQEESESSKESDKHTPARHPFKGKHIDFTL
jgi:hypothetical protein